MSAIVTAAIDLTTTNNTKLFEGNAGKVGDVNICFCNRHASSEVKIRYAYVDSDDIANVALSDYKLYDKVIKPQGDPLVWTGQTVKAGHSLMVKADTANAISVTMEGIEEDL